MGIAARRRPRRRRAWPPAACEPPWTCAAFPAHVRTYATLTRRPTSPAARLQRFQNPAAAAQGSRASAGAQSRSRAGPVRGLRSRVRPSRCGPARACPVRRPCAEPGGSRPVMRRRALLARWMWWRRRESNPRPQHCERCALPTELRPHAMGRGTVATARRDWKGNLPPARRAGRRRARCASRVRGHAHQRVRRAIDRRRSGAGAFPVPRRVHCRSAAGAGCRCRCRCGCRSRCGCWRWRAGRPIPLPRPVRYPLAAEHRSDRADAQDHGGDGR